MSKFIPRQKFKWNRLEFIVHAWLGSLSIKRKLLMLEKIGLSLCFCEHLSLSKVFRFVIRASVFSDLAPGCCYVFGPLVRRAIENVHFIKNIENRLHLWWCELCLDHALTTAVKTIFVKRLRLGFNSHRMDQRPDDFAGEFNVPSGSLPFKETNRRKY